MAFHGMLCAAPSGSVRGLSRSWALPGWTGIASRALTLLLSCKSAGGADSPWSQGLPHRGSLPVPAHQAQPWYQGGSRPGPAEYQHPNPAGSATPPHQTPEPLQNHPELPLRRSWKNRGRCQSACSTSAFSHSSW